MTHRIARLLLAGFALIAIAGSLRGHSWQGHVPVVFAGEDPIPVPASFDPDCDEVLTAADALEVLRVLAGLDAQTLPCTPDVDGSSAAGLADVLLLRRVVAGISPGITGVLPLRYAAEDQLITFTVQSVLLQAGVEVLWDGEPQTYVIEDDQALTFEMTAAKISGEEEHQVALRFPGGGTSNAVTVTAVGVSTEDRIAIALEQATISEDQALVYRVWAMFGDPRLPAQYFGSDGVHPSGDALRDLVNRINLGGFSQSLLADVAEYLLPPSAPGSWNDLALQGLSAQAEVQWETVSSTKFKVWWHADRPEDAEKAALLLEQMDSVIYPKLHTLMGREPASDSGQQHNGGDSKYDIYLIHDRNKFYGAAIPYSTANGCNAGPSYLLINSAAALGPFLLGTMAHEYMHSLQFAFNIEAARCREYDWVYEATATWAEDYVYKKAQSEQIYADNYLNETEYPLGARSSVLTPPELRMYGSYLFFFWLSHTYTQDGKGADVVRKMWEFAEARTEPTDPNLDATIIVLDQAIEASLGSSFIDEWPKFALASTNKAPYDQFKTWDGLTLKKVQEEQPAADLSLGYYTTGFFTPIEHAGFTVYSLHFAEGTKVVQVGLVFAQFNEVVQARVRYEGDVTYGEAEDWTDLTKSFCRSKPDQEIASLILVVSNSSYFRLPFATYNQPQQPVVAESAIPCASWEGTVTGYVDFNDGDDTVREDWTAAVRFDSKNDSNPYSIFAYSMAPALVEWTDSVTRRYPEPSGCSGQSAGSYTQATKSLTYLRITAPISYTTPGTHAASYSIGAGAYIVEGAHHLGSCNHALILEQEWLQNIGNDYYGCPFNQGTGPDPDFFVGSTGTHIQANYDPVLAPSLGRTCTVHMEWDIGIAP